MKTSGDNSDWNPEVMAMITRAQSAGYELKPKGKAPFGWNLILGSETVLDGAFLSEVEAEFARRNI